MGIHRRVSGADNNYPNTRDISPRLYRSLLFDLYPFTIGGCMSWKEIMECLDDPETRKNVIEAIGYLLIAVSGIVSVVYKWC